MTALSARLSAIASFVPEGGVLVDVGTDHAYLPIYLVQTGRIDRAIAADVREGPLARARAHISAAGLEGQIDARLSDGLSRIVPGEGNTLVIAGMGGMLMLRILQEGDLSGFETLILAPQSDPEAVRRGLQEQNLRICKETLVSEDGKYYPVLCVIHGADPDDDPVRMRFGKHLLPEAWPVLNEQLAAYRERIETARAQMEAYAADTPGTQRRMAQLKDTLTCVYTAQQRIDAGTYESETTGVRSV